MGLSFFSAAPCGPGFNRRFGDFPPRTARPLSGTIVEIDNPGRARDPPGWALIGQAGGKVKRGAGGGHRGRKRHCPRARASPRVWR